MSKKKKKKLTRGITLLIVLATFSYSQNNWLSVNHLQVSLPNLPEGFHGYKILQISDLHGKLFGDEQQHLVTLIQKENPDIIVVTGDSVDSRRLEKEPSIILFSIIVEIAPVYFVTGNHEGALPDLKAYIKEIEALGVIALRNEIYTLEKDGSTLPLLGMDDPNASSDWTFYRELADFSTASGNQPYILLAHRPNYIDYYSKLNIPLVFSGHAHGGQVRLPIIGGIVSPGQGFFPEYTQGESIVNNTHLIVSRGLGNSIFPQRIFNRPEIVVVTLK